MGIIALADIHYIMIKANHHYPQKGHSNSLDAFVASKFSEGATCSNVNINNNDAAVNLLWFEVFPIINGDSNQLRELLMHFGVDEEGMSPLCQ
eukprot:15367145-Ditylum_brightwellii.AAC.1